MTNGKQFDGSIEWRSDGPVLHLENGTTVKPVLEGYTFEQPWFASVVSPGGYASYGPKADDERAWLQFEEVDD